MVRSVGDQATVLEVADLALLPKSECCATADTKCFTHFCLSDDRATGEQISNYNVHSEN